MKNETSKQTNTINILDESEIPKLMRFAMYMAYNGELDRMRQEETGEEPSSPFIGYMKMSFEHAQKNETREWVPVIKDNEEVGFIIVDKGNLANECCVDYFIADSYVEEAHRRKGLMTKTVRDYMNKHKGSYAFKLLNYNKLSFKFWKSIFGDSMEFFSEGDECTFYRVKEEE